MTADATPAESPEAPADVGAPASTGVEVAPTEPASVDAPAPKVDTVWFPQETAKCGDTLEVKARLTAEGFDGSVDFQYKNARSGADVEGKSEVVGGALEVKQKWVARKFENTWDDHADVALTGKLMDNAWTLVNSIDAAKPLRVERPADGYSPSNVPGAARSTPQWVQDPVTNVWSKNGATYGWTANYAVDFKDGVVSVIGKVKLVPVGALVITAAMKTKWKAQIEGYWNKVFSAHRKACGRGDACPCDFGCCLYEIKVVCNFVETGEYTTVNVHAGTASGPWGKKGAWWFSDTWWESWSNLVPKSVRAHEFGHNIGLFDEYKGGATPPAVDPNTYTEPTSSIMSSGGSPMFWHFNSFLYVLGVMHKDKYKAVKRKRAK